MIYLNVWIPLFKDMTRDYGDRTATIKLDWGNFIDGPLEYTSKVAQYVGTSQIWNKMEMKEGAFWAIFFTFVYYVYILGVVVYMFWVYAFAYISYFSIYFQMTYEFWNNPQKGIKEYLERKKK
jgi:hypothetical protein